MSTNLDTKLKSVVALLERMASSGTMEQEQKEAIAKAVQKLRKAARSGDRRVQRKALAHVASLFLRHFG